MHACACKQASVHVQWKSMLDKQGYAGVLMMDLSKAFDTINHELY